VPVSAGGKTFACRLAITDATREKGLGGVTSLGADEGMLFAFSDSRPRNFWMYGCVIDLDIAFIDPFGFVTAVHTMPKEAPQSAEESDDVYSGRLKRYPSMGDAQYVLEVAPGTLKPLGVHRGSKVDFDAPALKRFIE
jgi:uncharacterized membrane protein (UPF0127 family)